MNEYEDYLKSIKRQKKFLKNYTWNKGKPDPDWDSTYRCLIKIEKPNEIPFVTIGKLIETSGDSYYWVPMGCFCDDCFDQEWVKGWGYLPFPDTKLETISI